MDKENSINQETVNTYTILPRCTSCEECEGCVSYEICFSKEVEEYE